MSAAVSFSKCLHAMLVYIDEGVKDLGSIKGCSEVKAFGDVLKSSEALKRLFRAAMDNLVSAAEKNAVFYAEKLLTLVDK